MPAKAPSPHAMSSPCNPQPRSFPALRADPIWKRASDQAGSCLILILLAPLLLLIGLLVRATSAGPVLYRQRRLGAGGRPFTIFKFRTMVANAEEGTGPVWARVSDPRVTRIGAFLRASHLDELPQLLNVLRGEMSLIGPRPERPYFVQRLSSGIRAYPARFAVKPGMTGLAQVLHAYDSDLDSARRKVAYDRLYIQRRSPSLDLWLLWRTALHMLRLGGGPRPAAARPDAVAVAGRRLPRRAA
jgi:lipopolysaccharide/colanic/teichoic acid biosynthesis glycosyltransferase